MIDLETKLNRIQWNAGNYLPDKVQPVARKIFATMRAQDIGRTTDDFALAERLNLVRDILVMGRSESSPYYPKFHWEDQSIGWRFAHVLANDTVQVAQNLEVKGEAKLGLAVVKMEIAQDTNSLELAKEAKNLLGEAAGMSERLSRRINWMDWVIGGDKEGYIGDHFELLVDRLAIEKEMEEGLWGLDQAKADRLTSTERVMDIKPEIIRWLDGYKPNR